MKKTLTTLVLAMALLVTISSCKEDAKPGESMWGTYTGSVTNELRINFGSIVNIDTTFVAPGVTATGTLSESAYEDSISLNVNMTVDGTPIDITVLGHIDSETSFTIPSTIYSYLNAVDIRVSGTGTVSGNTGTVNIKLSEPDGTEDLIYGDLDFVGTK